MGSLKTAGGYLLVLHNLEELHTGSNQSLRLLHRAKEERDWELCKELARFLMALDETGGTLREALAQVDLRSQPASEGAAQAVDAQLSPTRLREAGMNGAHASSHPRGVAWQSSGSPSAGSQSPGSVGAHNGGAGIYSTRGSGDYFGSLPGP